MKTRFVILMALCGLAICGCRDATAPETDLLRARQYGSQIVLTNRTNTTVYYFLMERTASPPFDVSMCDDDDPVVCPQVAPHQSLLVPLTSVFGYDPGDREIVVSHWIVTFDVFKHVESRSVILRLR